MSKLNNVNVNYLYIPEKHRGPRVWDSWFNTNLQFRDISFKKKFKTRFYALKPQINFSHLKNSVVLPFRIPASVGGILGRTHHGRYSRLALLTWLHSAREKFEVFRTRNEMYHSSTSNNAYSATQWLHLHVTAPSLICWSEINEDWNFTTSACNWEVEQSAWQLLQCSYYLQTIRSKRVICWCNCYGHSHCLGSMHYLSIGHHVAQDHTNFLLMQ